MLYFVFPHLQSPVPHKLGPVQLICNYYTVRHDGSSNFMRTWSLQVKLFFLFWSSIFGGQQFYTRAWMDPIH